MNLSGPPTPPHALIRRHWGSDGLLALFIGLSFPAAAVVLFQQPFPGECLPGSEMFGFELGLHYSFAELFALTANAFAAVCGQRGSLTGSSGTYTSAALPSIVRAP